MNSETLWSSARPFVLGGTAAVTATCVIQPIDMVKVRIQLQGAGGTALSRNPFSVASGIFRTEGIRAFYSGLSAAILRQLTYGTSRLGLFNTFTTAFADEKGNVTNGTRVFCSLAAGGLGAFIGTPADAALVRMQADRSLPEGQRRGYKNVGDALLRMLKEEGVRKGVFAGATPTIIRAMAVNVGMLSTYEPAKKSLEPLVGTGSTNKFLAGLVSGVCASAASLPFDFVKTRLQKQIKGPDGLLPYRNIVDCFSKVAKTEGPMAFYNGFLTYCVRISPHIMITWALMEVLDTIEFLKA